MPEVIELPAEDNRPPFFKNCPVCNAETPAGSIACPKCGVNLEIARANMMKDLALEVGKVGFVAGHNAATPKKKKNIPLIVFGWMGLCFLFLLLYGFIKDVVFPARYIPPASYPTVTRQPTSIPYPSRTPTSTPRRDCRHWSTITTKMNGQTVCVYGDVYQIARSREISTRIEFTDERNTFFLYSVKYYFTDETTGTELQAGDCVSVTGEVGIISNVPYIDIKEEPLYYCEDWMQ